MRAALALVALLAAPGAAETPIKFAADTFTVDEANKVATFTGHVVVDRDNMQLSAEKVVVNYGEGGTSDIKDITASGGVKIKTKDQSATGERAVFNPATQVMTMTGNVKISSPMGTLTGPQLVIDLKNNTSVFSGGSKGRVTGVFTPQ